MLDPVFNFFDKLIDQFSWKRLIFVVSLLCLFIVGVIVFESYTGHFRLTRIEKTLDLIAKFNALPPELMQQSKEDISGATKGLAKDIDAFTNGNATPFSIDTASLKIIAALAPWLLFAAVLPIVSGTESTRATIGGILMCAIPAAGIGYFLPSYEKAWINYLGFPFGYFVVSVYLVMSSQNRKKNV